MQFKKGDWVAFENGHGKRGDGYYGDGVVDYVEQMDGGDLLVLEEGGGGPCSVIKVWAKDCKQSDSPLIAAREQLAASIGRYFAARRGEKNAPI